MEGQKKKLKVEFVSPDAAYMVFSNHNLRPFFFVQLPLISLLAVWQAFPLLYNSFDIRAWIWRRFKSSVLPRFGISHVSWMDPYIHAFTGSRVVEFLLGDTFPVRKTKGVDLDILFCGKKHNQSFVHAVNISSGKQAQSDVHETLTKLGMVKTTNELYIDESDGYTRALYSTKSFKFNLKHIIVEPPLEENEKRYVDLIKTSSPDVNTTISLFDLACCRVSISPMVLKICDMSSLLKKEFHYPIDELFIETYPKTSDGGHPMLKDDGKKILSRLRSYRNRGFTIIVDRVGNTKGEVMAYMNNNLLLSMREQDYGIDWSYDKELAKRSNLIAKWVTQIAPKIEWDTIGEEEEDVEEEHDEKNGVKWCNSCAKFH